MGYIHVIIKIDNNDFFFFRKKVSYVKLLNIIQDSNFQIPTWRVVLKSHRDTDSCVFCNATPLQVRKSVIPFELRLDKEVEKKKKEKEPQSAE